MRYYRTRIAVTLALSAIGLPAMAQSPGVPAVASLPLASVTGLTKPPNLASLIRTQQKLSAGLMSSPLTPSVVKAALTASEKKVADFGCRSSDTSWDWAEKHVFGPIRFQGSCSACYDFAALGIVEAAYAIVTHGPDNAITQSPHLSEQIPLDCVKGNCTAGGWTGDVLDYMRDHGDSAPPPDYTAKKAPRCVPPVPAQYKIIDWSYAGSSDGIPSTSDIKEALCKEGPMAVAMFATPLFQQFKGTGTYSEQLDIGTSSVNHAVIITGWDNTKDGGAWRIRNSWDTDWGDGGYAWIAWRSNNIGYTPVYASVSPAPSVTSPIPAGTLVATVNKLLNSTISPLDRRNYQAWKIFPNLSE